MVGKTRHSIERSREEGTLQQKTGRGWGSEEAKEKVTEAGVTMRTTTSKELGHLWEKVCTGEINPAREAAMGQPWREFLVEEWECDVPARITPSTRWLTASDIFQLLYSVCALWEPMFHVCTTLNLRLSIFYGNWHGSFLSNINYSFLPISLEDCISLIPNKFQ